MNKIVFIVILLFVSCPAQNFSFEYEVLVRPNLQKSDFYQTKYMTLDIADRKSIFRENMERNADSLKYSNLNPSQSMGFENQFYIKKDLQKNIISKIITNGENTFSLAITDNLDWEITSEKKKINQYSVQKAKVNYGGREWTAWFSADFNINDGPYIFNGLPGLIIAINDNNEDYKFNLIQVKKRSNLFDVRTKVLQIDWNKFKDLATAYYDNPILEMIQRSAGKTSYFIDKNGNKQDIKVVQKQMAESQQEFIKTNNNPIELNHKIDYK